MTLADCFAFLIRQWRDEIVVTSAGNASEMWWHLTRETDRVFYLDASMSLASMFASGIAVGLPAHTVWAFSGDGAFCMNPGMLMVERQMALPNLKHFLVSNRTYGSTHDVALSNAADNDYVQIARGMGLSRVFAFDNMNALATGFEAAVRSPGHAFVVLEVEALGHTMPAPPMDGPELKFRFGRHLERIGGIRIFDSLD
ncbi:MAG: hypothetical protein FJX67_09145 [Alphaproteobacteria bacterium]|nr:hypothetical protein [Alphaproteobacteria bacterium]